MAYPYIPGSGSEALKGMSVFAGLLVSLGASSSVANVIAGYINTYGRVLKVGDMIEVGDVRGEVTQIRLHSTRLRKYTNEEVTIPNSTLLTSHVVNYSALAKSGGLILHTKVGIGYEVPWRQVHAMLLEAAGRTSGLAKEPAPFVLQRELGDFAVVYELNVARDNAEGHVPRLLGAAPEHPRRLQRTGRADHDAGLRRRPGTAEGGAEGRMVRAAGEATRQAAAG